MSVTFTTVVGGPEVNLHNAGAAEILSALGYPSGDLWGGEAHHEDFLGRVLVAQGLLGLTGDEHGTVTVTDGRWIEVGRSPGYLARNLRALHDLATWAHSHGAGIFWG